MKIFLLYIAIALLIGESSCLSSTCRANKAGCVKKGRGRVLEDLLINARDGSSGYQISWRDYDATATSLVCRCAQLAREKNYKVIGIQYYGECWGSKNSMEIISTKSITSTNCINGGFSTCEETAKYCFGTDKSSYLYTVDMLLSPIDGGYGEWSDWNKCSQSCNQGVQERSRKCDKPEPEHGGANCDGLGKPEETRTCEIQVCPTKDKYTTLTCNVTPFEDLEIINATFQYTASTPFCVVRKNKAGADSMHYKVSADLYSNEKVNHARMGLMFNSRNTNNYEFAFIHLRSEFLCYTVGRVVNGTENWRDRKYDQCHRAFQEFKWIHLDLIVTGTSVTFNADNQEVHSWQPSLLNTAYGGIVVLNGYDSQKVTFRNLEIS